jgi:CheY-like chemotaxis protein
VSTQGKTILLVEDSEPQIIQMSYILNRSGYTVQVARNGKEALESIQISIPDAMILDLMMPEVDGFQVLDSIRSQPQTSHIPVIILTAKHITKNELFFLKGNHIHQIIMKGVVNRTELLAHVQNMLNPTPKTARVSAKGKTSHDGKPVVLVIEDNMDNFETVKALLSENHEITGATDSTEGLVKARELVPDLILLDISLPGMDGFAVFDELRKDEHLRHIPVIALTARAMKGDREELLSYGFDGYISKPIDSDLMETTINDVLRKTE